MPCTLRRLEVWQVSPQYCLSCCKLPLPKSVKLSLHQVCNTQAVSTLLSHKICSHRLVNLAFRRSQPLPNSSARLVTNKSTKKGLHKIKSFWSGTGKRGSRFASKNNPVSLKAKKVEMEDTIDRSASDSDSDSVIILTDEDDDKPIRQRLIEYREGFVKAASKEFEDDKSLVKHEIGNERVASATNANGSAIEYEESRDGEGNSTSTIGIKEEYEDCGQREEFSTFSIGDKDPDNYHDKQVYLKTRTKEVVKKKDASEKSDSDEDEQFEKHFKQDINFVMAKFMVKKKVGFVCDIIQNPDPFKKKLRKLLDQADILIIKKSLDDGGKTFTPKELNLKKLLHKPAPPPPQPPRVSAISSTPGLSDEESPNTTQTLPVIDQNVPQMPVVSGDSALIKSRMPEKKVKSDKTFKFKPYCPPVATKPKKLPGFLPKLLQPAVVFPSIKAKSFKIPRAAKTKQPNWVTNGALWQCSLTVDDNGQYSRTEKERKRVPWASLVTRRLCVEFQWWLVRGSIREGDDCDWEDKEGVEKRDKDEVKRRREDLVWREKVLDKILGNGIQTGGWLSTRDPLGLDERDSGTGSLEIGNSTSNTVAGSDATEELTDNELNVSQQSMVTHIQTPTHTFCMDEVESDGTDCMDEKDGETLDINKNVQKVSNSSNLATLPGLRGPPPPVNRLISAPRMLQVLSVSEDLRSYPPPPPSDAPSVGFAFTRLSPVTPCDGNLRTSKEDATAQTDYSALSQSLSVLSGLVASKKTRFKLF